MEQKKKRFQWLPYLTMILTAGLVTLGVFAYLQNETITELNEVQTELRDIVSTQQNELAAASSTIADYRTTVLELEDDLTETRRDLRQEQRQVSVFREQLESLTGTVGELDRLARIDRELLRKYSRTSFLNENYRPAQLTKLPDRWVLEGRQDQYFLPEAWPYLRDMLESAQRDRVDLRVLSAFRSFDEQIQLKQQFTQVYGSGANQFSADQGFSEHQLGTAVDIVDPDTGATTQAFADTDAYEWLQRNAHRYGFILSYPPENEFYIFEPWHWRFVGRELATDLHRAGDYFYDWDQRRIDEYLINIFE